MVAMQKEHEIAKRLGNFGSNAGGQYMRQRTVDAGAANARDSPIPTGFGPHITKADILADRPGDYKMRAADSVRLSPAKKKTRFVTDRGIKEAGRESIGAGSSVAVLGKPSPDEDEDSDLDIV